MKAEFHKESDYKGLAKFMEIGVETYRENYEKYKRKIIILIYLFVMI